MRNESIKIYKIKNAVFHTNFSAVKKTIAAQGNYRRKLF